MDNFINKINIFKQMPINRKTILLIIFALIILISLTTIIIISRTGISYTKLIKMYNTSAILNSVVNNKQYSIYGLKDFFIRTAYNCCWTGSHVSLDTLNIYLKQGFRCLDFEIHSISDSPVVTIPYIKNNNNNNNNNNSLPINKVFDMLYDSAFSPSICSNFNDPLILHFRIINNNANMFENLARIISESPLKQLILKKQNTNKNYGNYLNTTPISNLKNKIIIVIYGSDPFYQSTSLNEFVHMTSGQEFMHIIYNNDIKSKDYQYLINFNKENTTIVLPDQYTNFKNPNFNECSKYGCQFIAMNFQNYDSNFQQYNELFKNEKLAFVLKP